MSDFLYHYHAEYREPTKVSSIDGIATLEMPIRDMQGYRILKSVIVKGLEPPIPAEKLIICSLTPLNK
jgi:hypothetical protein